MLREFRQTAAGESAVTAKTTRLSFVENFVALAIKRLPLSELAAEPDLLAGNVARCYRATTSLRHGDECTESGEPVAVPAGWTDVDLAIGLEDGRMVVSAKVSSKR